MPYTDNVVQSDGSREDKLPLYLFVYALCYALLHILPPYLTFEIKNLLYVGDVFDILTPIVIILLVCRICLLLNTEMSRSARSAITITLILGGVIFIEGHGIHLSANAISRHVSSNENIPLYSLTYFLDEILGHILWDSGIVILSIGLVVMTSAAQQSAKLRMNPVLIVPASVLYGFTYFVNAVEGQTVIFTLPIAVMMPLFVWGLARLKRKSIFSNPVLIFFALSYLVAVCLFAVWGVWRNGFPQFSDLGWV